MHIASSFKRIIFSKELIKSVNSFLKVTKYKIQLKKYYIPILALLIMGIIKDKSV